jgi:hypothetical protein
LDVVFCPKKDPNFHFEIVVSESAHKNHDPAMDVNFYLKYIKLDQQSNALASCLIKQNLSSTSVLHALSAVDPDCPLTVKDIDNIRLKLKKEARGELSPTQHMISTALANGYKIALDLDKNNEIVRFFGMSPISLFLSECFPDSPLLFDTTFNTNLLQLYLHASARLSSCAKSFFGFLSFTFKQEKQDFVFIFKVSFCHFLFLFFNINCLRTPSRSRSKTSWKKIRVVFRCPR